MLNSNPSEVVGLFARHQARLRGLVRCLMVAFVAIVAVVAFRRLTSAQDGKRLDQAFSRADTNGDGQLSPEEISRFEALKDHAIQSWVKANGCNTEPEIVALPDVANDKMKVIRKTWGGGHTWPVAPQP